MSDTYGRGDGLDVLRAVHGLLCGRKCSDLDIAHDPILHEGLLPHLLRMAFERLAGASEEYEPQRIAHNERQFYVDLHHDELQFLSSIVKIALSEEQAWDLFGTITRLVKLPLWRLEACADLLEVYHRQACTPSRAARPLLQTLVGLLSSPPSGDRAHVKGVTSALHQIAVIFERCPNEALQTTIEDDILLVLRPYSRLNVQEDKGTPPYVDATEVLADILSAYFAGISSACSGGGGGDDDEAIDVRAHFDYLTRSDNPDDDYNRLTWCLSVDLLIVGSSNGEQVHALHQSLLRLAKHTSDSESYATSWATALAVIEFDGKLAASPLGDALHSERGIRAYRDLLDATSSGVVVAGCESSRVNAAAVVTLDQGRYPRDQQQGGEDEEDEGGEGDERTLCSDSGDQVDTEQ
ncbi:hypothetical protein EV715DRAFT_293199 [Schizophyllum commune]